MIYKKPLKIGTLILFKSIDGREEDVGMIVGYSTTFSHCESQGRNIHANCYVIEWAKKKEKLLWRHDWFFDSNGRKCFKIQ